MPRLDYDQEWVADFRERLNALRKEIIAMTEEADIKMPPCHSREQQVARGFQRYRVPCKVHKNLVRSAQELRRASDTLSRTEKDAR